MADPRPQDTLRQLCQMFPSFTDWWAEQEFPPENGLVDNVYYEWTHHHVLQEFLDYFGTNHAQFSTDQIQQLGGWMSAAVSNEGRLENAVSTCFLEHIRQVRIERVLRPYLSKQAKAKSYA